MSKRSAALRRRPASPRLAARRWEHGGWIERAEAVAAECGVAILYNGASHAVMMASPSDLEDFAAGFSLSEGIVATPFEIEAVEVSDVALGLEVAITIPSARESVLADRRRSMAGASGCGLCGVISLERALRPLPPLTSDLLIRPEAVIAAIEALPDAQMLNRRTGAVHAAAWCTPAGRIVMVREDVGRHNALDKLIGAVVRAGEAPGLGMLVMTSRCSAELVQKAVTVGFEAMATVSAPTSLAIELANESGITLMAFARNGRFSVYAHPARLECVA